ncbi:hypothetical protein [Pseudomonas sp. B392_1p]|uniref:hypothetical protein n=1 Tax=Pseudomonas sp. B392_1p TaxID=3457507 RepID=UPI003FD19C2D
MESKKRLTITYLQNGVAMKLERVVLAEQDRAGVILDILAHERPSTPVSDVPYDASTLERRECQLRDRGITDVDWSYEIIE